MSHSLCKRQTSIKHPSHLTIPYFFYQYKLLCMVKMDLSILHFCTVFFFLLEHTRSYQWFYTWCLGNLFSTAGTVCIPEAFLLFCVCMPCSLFQNCETWLMFQVSFSHMYLTISIEPEKFSGLGIVLSNSRWEISEALVPWQILGGNIWATVEFPGKTTAIACVTDKVKLKTTKKKKKTSI